MSDVIDLYTQPHDPQQPVVALDERPTLLREPARPDRPMRTRKPKRVDYEYRRHGTANIFCIVEPKAGRHLTHATANRTRAAFAEALRQIARAYPKADVIHLITDNLNTHTPASLVKTFGPARGGALVRRFHFHYTPKHASWLNVAEIEASLVSRECLGRDRIATLQELQSRVDLWNEEAHRRRRKIVWKFTIEDAQRVFGRRWFNRILSKH